MVNINNISAANDARLNMQSITKRIDSHALSGHAKLFAKPRYSKHKTVEPLLKYAIPVLILIFLFFIALARCFSAYQHYEQHSANVQQATQLTLTTISAIIGNNPEPMKAMQRWNVETQMSRVTDQFAIDQKPVIIAADSTGRIFANSDIGQGFIGMNLLTLLDNAPALQQFGKRAGVQTITLSENAKDYSGRTMYAALAHLENDAGSILVLSPQAADVSTWFRQTISLDVTLFIATSVILIVVLYAYFIQVGQTKDANDIYTESQRRIDMALSRGRCGLWEWDMAQSRLFWSGSMYEMLGLPARDKVLTFEEAAKLMHPEDGNIYVLARLTARGEIREIDHEFRMRHANGSYVWLRARAQLIDRTGLGRYLVGIAMDVSEQHRLQKRKAEADQRLFDAIESTRETFVLWDKDDGLVIWNSYFQKVHNLPDDILQIGTKRDIVMAAARRPIVDRIIPTINPNGYTKAFEVKLADGNWLQISERRTKDGGLVSVGTDITALKLNQDRLRESEKRLMATISDLSRSQTELETKASELSKLNIDYQLEKERAQAANRSKSEFLANMSHELRTPLNAVIGFSEIIKNRMFGPLGSEKYEEYTNDIHSSGRHLLGLINDILDMSKIEAGHMEIKREKIKLNPVVNEALRLIATQTDKKSIQLEAKIEPDLELFADRRAMKQVLINLLSNAVKFTNDNGHVNVRVRKVGQAITFSVHDTGIGIPEYALSSIGQPFEQVQNQFSKSQEGSGLGLAISRSLTELHGGSMRINSVENIGTIVSIRIPVRDKNPVQDKKMDKIIEKVVSNRIEDSDKPLANSSVYAA